MVDEIPDSAITDYLAQVDQSGVLGKSKRRLTLLEYLIRAELDGRGETLKAYSIAIDVFDRPVDFDPSNDSSVRVEMGRLRTAIAAFENDPETDCAFAVEIPVGSYRPVITKRVSQPEIENTKPTVPRRRKPRRRVVALVTAAICVMAFGLFLSIRSAFETPATSHAVVVSIKPFLGDATLTAQVETAIRRSLVRSRIVATISEADESNARSDFSLQGLVNRANASSNRVDVELINDAVGQVVWAKSVIVDAGEDIEERVAQEVGNELRVRLLGASKDFLEGRDPERLTSEQLFVMATWVPGPATNAVAWELERIALMDLALSKDPDVGSAHSVMADKLSYLANVYAPSDTPELHEQATMHRMRALELAPSDPDVVFNIAQSQWHSGQIGQSIVTMRRVLDLDPGHDLARFLVSVIPYTCATPPPEVIDQAVAFDEALSPSNPIRWLTLTWIGWLNLNVGNYEKALEAEQRAALIFEIPYTSMRHAVLLNKLGRPDEAVEIIRRQQRNWPGISPDHFAQVTIPRLCAGAPEARNFIQNYEELATAMDGRL